MVRVMNSLNPCEIPRVSYALKIQSTLRGGISKSNFFNHILLIKTVFNALFSAGQLCDFQKSPLLLEDAIPPNCNQKKNSNTLTLNSVLMLEGDFAAGLCTTSWVWKARTLKWSLKLGPGGFSELLEKHIFHPSSPISDVIRAMITQTGIVCIQDFPHCLFGNNMPMIAPIGNPIFKRATGDRLKMDWHPPCNPSTLLYPVFLLCGRWSSVKSR